MSREIKFRSWNIQYETMEQTHDFYISGQGDEALSKNLKNKRVPMQYIGIKDKNGVEIYECDIVELADEFDEGGVFSIEWQVNGFWLDGWDGNEYGFPDGSSLEVIGNIYENPELLENKNESN